MEFLSLNNCKKVISGLAMIAAFTACNSVPNDLEIKLPFEEVKTYKMEIVRKKLSAAEQNVTNPLRTITDIIFEVKAVSDNEVKGIWIYGNTKLDGQGAKDITPDDLKLINIYQGLKIPLTFTKEGKVKLDNFDQLNKDLERLFLSIYGGDTLTESSEMYQKITSMFRQKGANQDLFLTNYFPEITMLFRENNHGYENNTLVNFDSIQSPYSPEFLKVHSQIEFSKEEEELEIFISDSISTADLDAQLNQYMASVYGPNAQNVPQNQVPKIGYRGETLILLNDDEVLKTIESTKFYNNAMQEIIYSTSINILEQ